MDGMKDICKWKERWINTGGWISEWIQIERWIGEWILMGARMN